MVIQFTQKIGRSATRLHRLPELIEYSLLRKLVGLQPDGVTGWRSPNTVYSENWSVCNQAHYGMFTTIIQFTQKIGRSATSGTGTKHLAEYSLLRKLVGLQLVASIAVATI